MNRQIVSTIMLTLLLTISLLASTFFVLPRAVGGSLASADWTRTYGWIYDDWAHCVVETSDGGYALAGSIKESGGWNHFWLVKVDSSGNMQWNQAYGGIHHDVANSIVQTKDGGYALYGTTDSFGAGGSDGWLVKVDSSGNMQWNKTYGDISNDDAYCVVETTDGGYALAGAISVDFWLLKTDSSGNLQWNKTYGGADFDVASCVVQTKDGGYAITGYSQSFGGPSGWLVKTDSSGNMQWNKTYGGASYQSVHWVVETSDGGYALAGVTTSLPSGAFWLIKTDSAGNVQWDKAYGGTNACQALSVVQTRDGGYALTGITRAPGVELWDGWLVKTDSSGNQQWNKTYGGTGDDEAYSIVQTGDGGYALGGSTNSSGEGGYDFWLVKLTPSTIFIRGDGSVDPSTAPIQRSGDIYTLTDNIYTSVDGIVIEKNNVILDGAGFTLQGTGAYSKGVDLSGQSNVTIKNMKIEQFYQGIYADSCSLSMIAENNVTNNGDGICLWYSSNNAIYGNSITANNHSGVYLQSSSSNILSRSNITNNLYGVILGNSSMNKLFHNNLIENTQQTLINTSANFWDHSYPSGGNYWSDYNGTDSYRGAYQNITGSDQIGDTHYNIDANNTDNYPLMDPFGPSTTMAGENVTVSPTEDVGLIFESVTEAGSTTVNKTATGPSPPLGFELAGQYYDIKTTAQYSGNIEIRIVYDDSDMTQVAEENLRLRRWNETLSQWVDITTHVDTENNVVYGVSSNLSIFGVTSILPLPEGIAVVTATCSKTVVCQGYNVTTNVTVRNQGGIDKTFDLIIYANTTIIGNQTVSDLAPSAQVTIIFTSNTTAWARNNYTISAYDHLVSWVSIAIVGDVNADGKVEMKDIGYVCMAYGSYPGHPKWNPVMDINDDGTVDMKDIGLACMHYGEHYP